MPVKYASRQAYEQLLALGIEIYEYQPTMMHTKTIVVDGVVEHVRSANFDNRSLELNDELNVAVSTPASPRASRRTSKRTSASSAARARRRGAAARSSRRRASSSGRISGRYSRAIDLQLRSSAVSCDS